MRRALALLVLLAGLAAVPRAASATIIGDPTLTVGAGKAAVAGEIDLGLSGDFETNRLWVRGDYGLAPNMDGFLRAGFFDGDADAGGFGDADLDGFGFGGGVRADLQTEKDWHIGGLAQIMYNKGETKITLPFGLGSFEEDFDWWEFDVAGAGSFRGAGPVVPYVGARLGLITGDPDTDFQITLFGGMSYAISPVFSVGGELRLIDDDSLGLYARYRF